NMFPMKDMHSIARISTEIIPESSTSNEYFEQSHENVTEKDDNEAPKRSKRRRIEKSFGDDFIVYLVDDTPTSIAEAYASPDADDWKEAVHNEMDSILSNGTWELSERPHGCKPVGCKWVFKKKLRPDGTIEKYKARLVAKGYTQREGEDYFDTYSPVARLTTIRVLLSMAASYGLIVHQMDVKTAFLNGELEEEIYMDQPDGFVVKGEERKVCKLLKSLYGLKQAPKQWHEKFDRTLTYVGFVVNEADKCVYYRHGGGEGVILCLYVDDILIFGTNMKVIHEVKSFLSKCFDMKDLGEADVILNIKLIKNESGITLTQSHYVEKILSRFGYIDSKSSPTPYDPSVTLRKNRRIAVDQLRYSQIVGSLMYLASATRPDISFAVSKLSRFMSNPGTDHWHALDRVMRYLCGTMSYGIHYSGHPAVLEGYSDSNWISDVADLYATSGYVFTFGGGAVSWRSCKQTILTRSTMEAELTALDTTTVESEWLRELLMDLPVVEKPVPAILLNCDNQTVIVKVNNSKDNAKSSRHVKRRLKSVRKLRNSGVITVTYIQTDKNLADPFTKGLSRNVIESASREMGLRPVFGKRSARLLKLFITGRLPSKSGGAAYRRLQRRLLRPVVPVINNVVINNVTAATSSATPSPPPPPDRQFPELTMAGFSDALRPDKFTGVHFKRWQVKAMLWLTHLKVFEVSDGLPEGTISDQDQNKFKENNTLFVGCVLSILADRLCDVYMHITDGKELWDALNAKFGATDAGSELYIMESFHDIRMKARAKDNTEKGEGQSSANMVQKKPYSKNKGNNKPSFNKPMKTTTFKKKKMIIKADLSCFTCGETGHFSKDYPERADRKKKARQVNTVTASNADGYGNLFTVLSVARDSSVLMGNGSHASVRGVGTVDLKFTSGKIVQHVPTMNKNLVSGSLLCRDGFKVVLESNKVVVSKFGQFIAPHSITTTIVFLDDLTLSSTAHARPAHERVHLLRWSAHPRLAPMPRTYAGNAAARAAFTRRMNGFPPP
ncbi:hypothetical protein QYE76_005275, partial [Lolium multiflorum]